MFQFTTTTVINTAKAVDYNGNPVLDKNGVQVDMFKGTAEDTVNNVPGVFNVFKNKLFKKEYIESAFKASYVAGVLETATLTIPSATSGDLIRVTVYLKLDGSTQSDYSNHSSLDFKRAFTAEIKSSGTAATDAAEFVKVLKDLNKTRDYSYFSEVSNASAVITLKVKRFEQRFESIVLEKVTNPLTEPVITELAKGVVTVAGKNGFGDDLWMIKAVRVPTDINNRAFGILRDEIPVIGGNYSQFTIRYKTPNKIDDIYYAGTYSITTHVFWVAASQVSAFETALETTLGERIPGNIALTAAGNATSLVNELTLQLTVSGAVGNVTYASSDTDLATISATGLVTAKAAPALGDVVLTATDSLGNVASITIEIKAA